MVLAERNPELVRNGRRSRGPSPNGHGPSTGSASGPSGGPGGAGTPETSSDDDNSIKRNGKTKSKQSEYEEKIRVGRDYQAIVPPLVPEQERKPECLNDRALLVWAPTKDIPDMKLEEYISVAKEKYGYNGEQALGMLFWHKHDLERAVMDLANFTPFPDEWTQEDKVLFEQAFQFHGKSFHRIRQMLPDKSIASLVKYYYSWKKTRHRQSVMDRQEKVKANKEGSSENGSDNGSNEDSDNDDKDQALLASASLFDQANSASVSYKLANSGTSNALASSEIDNNVSSTVVNNSKQQQQQQLNHAPATVNAVDPIIDCNGTIEETTLNVTQASDCGGGGGVAAAAFGIIGGGGGCCSNCGVVCNLLNTSPHGKLCSSCHHHWRRTGNKRPTSGPYFGKRSRDRNAERHKRKPPRGMYINHDDIVALASMNDNQDELLANIDREIVSLLSQVQLNKQNMSSLKRKISEHFDDIRPTENINHRINARWTNDECLLAVEGVRKYGKDFQTIAETIGTKTEAHVRTFYMNNRRRYNLDQILKKHEIEKESASSTSLAACSSSTGANSSPSNCIEAANTLKKDEQQNKKRDFTNNLIEDSDNTTSSETATILSKSTTTTTPSIIEERKLECLTMPKDDDGIVEMDLLLNTELMDGNAACLAKRFALSIDNQDFPKSSPI